MTSARHSGDKLPRMEAVSSERGIVAVTAPLPTRETWTVLEMMVWTRDTLGFSHAQIAGALGVTGATIRRWQSGETTPRGRHRIQFDALQDLRALLAEVFTAPADAMTWLRKSPGIGDGVPPLDMIKTGAITPLVGGLATVESGAFL